MKTIAIKVYPEKMIGKIKKLNGGNLAPPISTVCAGYDLKEDFKELNLACTRLHDSPLDNPGCRLVDVNCIFANFHADADDPRNYYFEQTDDYLQQCMETGTVPYYRLGASIEHSRKKYFVNPPADYAKWTVIAANIIRHYTEGWNNGFHYPIIYWEIWNEPDGKSTWNGSEEQFYEFYAQAATELKRLFPHLKFGGPAHGGYHHVVTTKFLRFCAENKIPLDFYSYHHYIHEPFQWIQETPRIIRRQLDELGLTNTEIHVNEWHYVPSNDTWRQMRTNSSNPDLTKIKTEIDRDMKGLDSAAFTCATMSGWQDVPMDMGCFYTCTGSKNWGMFETHTATRTKLFYGMKAFGDIVRFPERIQVDKNSDEVTAIGGKDENGNYAVLLTLFKTGPAQLTIEFPEKIDFKSIDAINDQQDYTVFYYYDFDGKKITFHSESSSAVYFIRFRRITDI